MTTATYTQPTPTSRANRFPALIGVATSTGTIRGRKRDEQEATGRRAADDATRWEFVEFGTQLRRRRRSQDLTQLALARAANCSKHTIKKLEQGLRRPSPQMALSLAGALGLTAEERTAFVRAGTGAIDADPTDHGAAEPLATILGTVAVSVHWLIVLDNFEGPDLAADLLTVSDRLRSLVGATHLPMMNEWRAVLIDSIRAVSVDTGDDEPDLEGEPREVVRSIDTIVDHLLRNSPNRSGRDPESAGAS